jgi:hypothetical protein
MASFPQFAAGGAAVQSVTPEFSWPQIVNFEDFNLTDSEATVEASGIVTDVWKSSGGTHAEISIPAWGALNDYTGDPFSKCWGFDCGEPAYGSGGARFLVAEENAFIPSAAEIVRMEAVVGVAGSGVLLELYVVDSANQEGLYCQFTATYFRIYTRHLGVNTQKGSYTHSLGLNEDFHLLQFQYNFSTLAWLLRDKNYDGSDSALHGGTVASPTYDSSALIRRFGSNVQTQAAGDGSTLQIWVGTGDNDFPQGVLLTANHVEP